ncbi:DUF3040 domain-containing protein [Actinomyces bowdenii]|uniref:DUF3040 domain-containing protein n=1 Tax=Actinomyces bowdenii TaxID=131109 RepID=A0A3P1V5B7_9ACTO|nr:DUF3040 domain-containing protein [Actinomyces bowdenii]MBO3724289.1 DUF3040 domain-containing protein [Actinomyces bowdenii]RRD29392.1 DUF3040 domain-containing protein [Actinomyces bowdenii]
MALSEREQQVLRDLESQLHQEDPALADSLERDERRLTRPSPRHVGAGVALVLVGLSLLVGGVSVGHGLVSILLGVAGFAIAVWGVSLALTRVSSGPKGPIPSPPRRGPKRPNGRRGSGPSFMDRQSERWDRRRDSQG